MHGHCWSWRERNSHEKTVNGNPFRSLKKHLVFILMVHRVCQGSNQKHWKGHLLFMLVTNCEETKSSSIRVKKFQSFLQWQLLKQYYLNTENLWTYKKLVYICMCILYSTSLKWKGILQNTMCNRVSLVCGFMYMCVNVHVKARRWCWMSSSVAVHLHFWDRVSPLNLELL